MEIRPYPLAWPPTWPRTEKRQWAPFRVSQEEAQKGLFDELRRLGAGTVVLSTNIPLRRDGKPYANYRIDDPGVAVYFHFQGEQRVIPCDRWETVGDNIRAIAKTIEALRGIDRWGTGKILDAAFAGFAALPAGGTASIDPFSYFGLEAGTTDLGALTRAYKRKAAVTHPDAGGSGSTAAFIETVGMYDMARKILKGRT